MTGSRGSGFGPLFAPTLPAFGTFSLFADVVVDVCCSKLDAVFIIFVTFSSGIGCEACGLEMVMGKSPFVWLRMQPVYFQL